MNPVIHFRNLISNLILMVLQSAKGLPAYRVPKGIRKKSFAKKRKKKWWKVPEDIKEIYKK